MLVAQFLQRLDGKAPVATRGKGKDSAKTKEGRKGVEVNDRSDVLVRFTRRKGGTPWTAPKPIKSRVPGRGANWRKNSKG